MRVWDLRKGMTFYATEHLMGAVRGQKLDQDSFLYVMVTPWSCCPAGGSKDFDATMDKHQLTHGLHGLPDGTNYHSEVKLIQLSDTGELMLEIIDARHIDCIVPWREFNVKRIKR